jgi:hypothetical protein
MTKPAVFVVRGIVFLVILFALDFLLGSVLHKLYFLNDNKYSYGILKTEAEVIIVGSSRAEHHYIPSVLTDSLGLTCFNMGSGGQNIYYDYGIINAILARYRPKIIIVDLMYIDYEVTTSRHNTDNLSIFLPYRNLKEIREVVNLRGATERIKLLSRVYPFNSQASNIVYSILKGGDNPHLIMDGYIPLEGEIHLPVKKANQGIVSMADYTKVDYLKRIIDHCRSRDVRLILVKSPTYTGVDGNELASEYICNYASKSGADFWNYGQDTLFLFKKALFKDEMHLNHKGAELFSGIIAQRIRATGHTSNKK